MRAFHPDLGAWTTPDAYEGDIHDRASQQKYMWNRGNPVDYDDPTGYYPGETGDAANHPYIWGGPNSKPPTPKEASEALKQFNPINADDGKAFLSTSMAILGFIAPEAKAPEAAITLFRAVGEAELHSIISSGLYGLGSDNMVKYFAPTFVDAQKYAAYCAVTGEKYTITSAVFYTNNLPPLMRDFGFSHMYALDASHLPHGPVTIHR